MNPFVITACMDSHGFNCSHPHPGMSRGWGYKQGAKADLHSKRREESTVILWVPAARAAGQAAPAAQQSYLAPTGAADHGFGKLFGEYLPCHASLSRFEHCVTLPAMS